MTKRFLWGAFLTLWVIVYGGIAWGGTDPGISDTCRVGTATVTQTGIKVSIPVTAYNDETLQALQIPLKFSGVSLRCDSVSWIDSRVAYINSKPITIDNVNQKINIGVIRLAEDPIPVGDGLIVTLWFTVKDNAIPEVAVIDTFQKTTAPVTVLKFVETGVNNFPPKFLPGSVHINTGPVTHRPEILVSSVKTVKAGDTLRFKVIALDPDTGDVLTITKSGIGDFTTVPHSSPDTGFFSWAPIDDDTLNSPYTVTFIVTDSHDSTDTGSTSITVLPSYTPPTIIDGDLNGDGEVDVVDVVFLINFFFYEGPPPNPLVAADINGDCYITIEDVIYLCNSIFSFGPAPAVRCLPGDVNYDGYVNLLDVDYFIVYLLLSGTAPRSMKSSDVDANCLVDAVDLAHLINFLIRGGPILLPGCAEPLKKEVTPEIAEISFASTRMQNNILEVPVNSSFRIPVAAAYFEIEYDPQIYLALEPTLTSRTDKLELYFNAKDGIEKVGIFNKERKADIQPGDGPLALLRFQVLDANRANNSPIVIKDASLVDVNAFGLEERISGNNALMK